MKKTSFFDKVSVVVGTLFGVGYTPKMPGSAACLVAVLVFILIKDPVVFAVFTLVSVIISYAVSSRAEKFYGVKDCKKIVIDDFSGQLITYLFIPHTMRFLISGFFLFRMMDMLKIPPADSMEKLPGAGGIVGDDVVAGIYALVLLHTVRILLNIPM